MTSPLEEYTLGCYLLYNGNYEEGLPLHERRLALSSNLPPGPMWDGGWGRRVAVFQEAGSGIGDCICFGRYVSHIEAISKDVAVVATHRPFLDLLSEELDITKHPNQHWDCWCAIKSLPAYFNTTLETVPQPLSIDVEPMSLPAGRKIGLRWSGSPTNGHDPTRSIPFEIFSRLVSSGAEFYGLYEYPIPNDEGVIDVSDRITSMRDTAALIRSMDLVVTVDTSVAHLAGSLGVPTWIFIPSFQDNWVWGKEAETTPWYPSAKLFRKSQSEEWSSVVDRVAQAIRT